MSEQLVRALGRLEVDRMVEKVKRGWAEMPLWVFCTDEGTPLDESRVRKAFSQVLRRAKLPSFRLYDLRHTYASLLLAQGSHHLRELPARPHRRYDDASLVRPLDPSHRQARDGCAG